MYDISVVLIFTCRALNKINELRVVSPFLIITDNKHNALRTCTGCRCFLYRLRNGNV